MEILKKTELVQDQKQELTPKHWTLSVLLLKHCLCRFFYFVHPLYKCPSVPWTSQLWWPLMCDVQTDKCDHYPWTPDFSLGRTCFPHLSRYLYISRCWYVGARQIVSGCIKTPHARWGGSVMAISWAITPVCFYFKWRRHFVFALPTLRHSQYLVFALGR